MSMIVCPACGKPVSIQASSCPQCGQPIAEPPKTGGGSGRVVEWIFFAVVLALLAFSNPTDTDMRLRVVTDGWVPISFERTNLIVVNWVRVTGATGSKATYLGIGGGIFKLPGSD